MKKTYTIILIFLSNWAIACSCSQPTVLDNIYKSDFIAVAKILKIEPNAKDKDYHDIEVELIDVYKGERITHLKIWSTLNSSCSFFTPVNTKWLIFASFDKDKVLSFHYCGGSEQINPDFDLKNKSGVDRKHETSLRLKLNVLTFFRDKKLFPTDKTQLKISWPTKCFNNLKGFDGDTKDFMVFECMVNEDMSVTDIKPVKRFNNKKLSRAFAGCIQSELKNNDSTKKSIPKKIKQYLLYYFYPNERGGESFISVFDL